jgi:hypothetical protein
LDALDETVGVPQPGRRQVRGRAAFNFDAGQLREILKSECFGRGIRPRLSFRCVCVRVRDRLRRQPRNGIPQSASPHHLVRFIVTKIPMKAQVTDRSGDWSEQRARAAGH